MKFCPSCGAKKLREQDRFCMNCGEPYPTLAEPEQPAASTAGPVAEAPAQPATETTMPENLFEQPAPAPIPEAAVPQAPAASASHVQPSKLAASAENAFAASQPAPAFQPEEPAPAAPAQPQPVQPQTQQTAQPVAAPPAPSVQEDVDAEAASLRDSIDKMLGGEEPVQPQPDNLFDPGVLEEEPVAQPPYAENQFGEPAAPVYEAAVYDDVQYDEYGNPVEAVAEESLFEEPAYGETGFEEATAGDTLGFATVDENANLFDEPGQSDTENLFANAPTPRQQYREEPRRQQEDPYHEKPRQQRYEELNRAVETAAGPDTEKWQRLQQDDNIQDLYAREERKQKPPEVQLPEYTEKKSKRRGGGGSGRTVGIIITAIVVFVVGTVGATLGLLYYRNSPAKAIDALIEAIEDEDYIGLNNMVELVGVEGTTDGWAAFCNAFESTSAQRDLQNQLKNQAKKGATGSDEYPAVVMESEPLFLFVKRYYVSVQGIDLIAEGIFEADTTLNGLFMNGEVTDQGIIYRGFMPGRYQYELYWNGEEIMSGEIDAFETESANKLQAGGAVTQNYESATVTISNAKSDDATLYVADRMVDAKPVGGVVTIENVPLGSEIRIEANVDGAVEVARVIFSDINVTSLAFGEYTATGAEQPGTESTDNDGNENDALRRAQSMTASDINTVLGTYYRSYLTSINDQTTNTLQNSTSANTQAMASRITAENNASNIFEYVGVSADATSIEASEANGVATVTFTADFSYRYTPRDGGDTQDGGNKQKVTMVYEDGEWRVSGMEFVSAE